MALIPRERFYTLLLGDSIVAGLSRYPNIWKEYLAPINALKLGIGGDRVENFIWQAINLPLPSSVKNIVILCGTNNIPIPKYFPGDITDGIFSLGSIFQKKSNGIKAICSHI